MLRAQGALPAALESYQAALAIAERLAEADPGNADWQRDLAVSLQRAGWIAAEQGRDADALATFRRGLVIMEKLVARAPDHAAFIKDRDWFAAGIAELGD